MEARLKQIATERSARAFVVEAMSMASEMGPEAGPDFLRAVLKAATAKDNYPVQ
jgi:hypothetical protein